MSDEHFKFNLFTKDGTQHTGHFTEMKVKKGTITFIDGDDSATFERDDIGIISLLPCTDPGNPC